jgi:hypothetical protein
MADLSWSYELKPGERANPVLYITYLDPTGWIFPTDDQLSTVFKTDGYRLQTWGRSVGADGKTKRCMDPHWIAVRNGTPLHNDKAYPRYTHHLKIRVDEGIFARGLNKKEVQLVRGLFYVLDTHSPHQVFHRPKKPGWNVSCSIDSDTPLNPKTAIPMLLEYIQTKPFLPDGIS